MLSELRIENFAIIQSLELEFKKGLVIVTGETGAGKSILLDAIMALVGGRVDATMVRSGASFKEVADILGHGSLTTTGIYAKLDLPSLAQVALPWPGGAQ